MQSLVLPQTPGARPGRSGQTGACCGGQHMCVVAHTAALHRQHGVMQRRDLASPEHRGIE